MGNRKTHLTALTARPASAQTVQELKYDTLLVYIDSAYTLAFSGILAVARVSDLFGEIGPNIPYKSFYGGSGSGGGGTGTS